MPRDYKGGQCCGKLGARSGHALESMNILSIQSSVVFGHVGNSAAVFPLQRLGFEVWPINTVTLSNHPAHGTFRGCTNESHDINELVRGLGERGVLRDCAAVLSGYLGSAANGGAVLDAVRAVKAANPQAIYCCDPVMGESGRGYYVAAGIPAFFAEQALPLADILLPNRFEIEVLADRPCPDLASSADAAESLLARGPRLVVVTGLPMGERRIAAVAVDRAGAWVVDAPRLELSAHGAGDTFAALFLGHYLRRRSPGVALARAMSAQHAIMRASARRGGAELQIIAAQDAFARPKTLFKAKRLR